MDEASRRQGNAQLPLDLPAEPRFSENEFLVSPSNQAAFAMIAQWPEWPDPSLLLVGPPGSGKSHLAAIWAGRAGARAILPCDIPAVSDLSQAVTPAYALDGADAVGDEIAFFHFLNFVAESKAFLLMSARRPPSAAGVKLPDLLSRLRRAPVIEIGAPDDDLIRVVLDKLFRDRQLIVEAALIDYVALRLERSLGAARSFVQALDREALARGRRVTRSLAGDVLETFQVS